MMKLTNKQYDVLKWVVAIVMPAAGTFLGVVFTQINWDQSESFLIVWTALTAFMGTVLGVSSNNYGKSDKNE